MSESPVELTKDYNRQLPDWVPDPIKERAIDQRSRDEWLKLIGEELHQNLKIEENLPQIDADRVDRFYNQVSTSIFETATELHLPIPGTQLTQIWSLHKYEKRQGEARDKDASAPNDEYLIKFHPGKIEEMVEMGSFSQKIEVDLVVRHEMLHLWERLHLPEVQKETSEKLTLIKEKRPEIYQEVKDTLTGKEMRAKMFELEGLKGEDVKTIREFLYKSLLILIMKAEITERKKRRRALDVSF